MPIDLPTGFLTRPEAAKKYNRSQRALERDLDVALTIQDQDLLAHWKLVTKDGVVRNGGEVTLELVKSLVADGMAPAWCVAESFLEEKFGRKGTPRPTALTQSESNDGPRQSKQQKTSAQSKTTPESDETVFLKGIIQNLEREKQQERQRHDQIVSKLFQQLEVKDKQISAWDEVTQGLTKALATGQITPNIDHLLAPGRTRDTSMSDTQSIVDAAPGEEGSDGLKKGTARPKTKSATAKRSSRDDKPQHGQKPKWNEFPTFKKLFSRR